MKTFKKNIYSWSSIMILSLITMDKYEGIMKFKKLGKVFQKACPKLQSYCEVWSSSYNDLSELNKKWRANTLSLFQESRSLTLVSRISTAIHIFSL